MGSYATWDRDCALHDPPRTAPKLWNRHSVCVRSGQMTWPFRIRYGPSPVPEEVETAYQQFLAQAATLPPRPLAELAAEVIRGLSQNGLQETVTINTVEVDGHAAQVIDTWDHLTHTMRRRYLLLIHDDNLFFVRAGFGEFSEIDAAFRALIPSIRFAAEDPGVARPR